MRLYKKNFILLLIFAIVLTSCVPAGVGETVKFEKPDIKDDFCGVHLNFQYCKCAFHNEYCEAVSMNKSQANNYVQSEFDKWLAQQLENFQNSCLAAGGINRGNSCQYCQEGFTVQDETCVASVDVKPEFQPDGPLTEDCQIKTDEFSRDWKKYSDIDEAIPFAERSYEAKQALTSYDAMIDLMI